MIFQLILSHTITKFNPSNNVHAQKIEYWELREFRMSQRKDIRQKITYADNIEELEKGGELLVNPTEYIIEEVQAGEDIIRMRNGCFLAMSRKLSVNQRITISGKNEYRFFFQNHCYFFE